jgi:Zinc dependent phospholipase C
MIASFVLLPFFGRSLGVLTHEAIIDASWDKSIVPLLKARYPAATAEDLKNAHAYAYGGAICPDMGYYPFNSILFTNLVHYVRSGDMINALLRDANNINEYAFALGFLSHYEADNYGHPIATNRSVPLLYPKLRKKYGSTITYAENKISHMRMEFAFDVLQVSKGNYASQTYHDFIGFKVDTSVLSRAFMDTYGIDINKVFNNHLPRAVEVFRFFVANVFPLLTKSSYAFKSSEKLKTDSTITSKRFRYKMQVKKYNKEYGTGYKHAGFFPTVMAVFIKVLPKVGPLRALKFKTPTAQAEKYFDESFDTIILHYAANLQHLREPGIVLKDIDFDTGRPTQECEYSLADETYNSWLVYLDEEKFRDVTVSMKGNIVGFYTTIDVSPQHKYSKKCHKLYDAFVDLKKFQPKITEISSR